MREHGPLARFEPASVLCLSGPVGDRSEDEARALVRDGLREVAPPRAPRACGSGLEPTHLSESGETSFLSSIGDAIALLDEAGLDDVGVMVDSVHVWDTPGLAAEVALHALAHHRPARRRQARPGRARPRAARARASRTPSCSSACCARRGFDGYLDIEIFSTPEAFWGLPVERGAARAAAAGRSLIAQS